MSWADIVRNQAREGDTASRKDAGTRGHGDAGTGPPSLAASPRLPVAASASSPGSPSPTWAHGIPPLADGVRLLPRPTRQGRCVFCHRRPVVAVVAGPAWAAYGCIRCMVRLGEITEGLEDDDG
jgi:hypothetical protein